MDLFPQIWDVGERFRDCDHRATMSSMLVTGTPPGEFDGSNYFQIENVSDNPTDFMRTCEETGCSL
jgi:hypothetical protein